MVCDILTWAMGCMHKCTFADAANDAAAGLSVYLALKQIPKAGNEHSPFFYTPSGTVRSPRRAITVPTYWDSTPANKSTMDPFEDLDTSFFFISFLLLFFLFL